MKLGSISPKVGYAIELVEGGMTVYAAAKQAEVSESSVHRAIRRTMNKCPTCGRVLPPDSGTNTTCETSKNVVKNESD
jgi:uncharacterized OB-fold protein